MLITYIKSNNMLKAILYRFLIVSAALLPLFFITCAVIISLVYSGYTYAAMPKIVIASDYRCPYICNAQADSPGYLIELAEKIFEVYGIQVEHKIMAWSDALKAAESGDIDGVIGISDIEGRDLVLPSQPQAYSTMSVFARTDLDWTYDDPESLSGKKIAIVLDYYLNYPPIQQYITDHYLKDPWTFTVESGENAVIDSINSVIDKTSDVYIGYQDVVTTYLSTDKHLSTEIKDCGKIVDTPIPLYIAFSGSKPDSAKYLKMLEDGMASIESIGNLKDLKTKYKIK